ncbi:MAG: hypothetical protein ACI4PF_04860 [Christensenellales bacterium]
MKIFAKIFRLLGLFVSGILTFLVVFTKFIKEQPARVKLSMLGVVIALVLFFIFLRFGKMWLKNKLSAIATAKELNVNGRTKPLFQTLLTMLYIFYPAGVLVIFLYGMQVYNGILWLDVLTLIGCIAVYFVFEFIALWYERYALKKEQLQRLEQEKEDMAERVANKINVNYKIKED